MVSWRVAAGDVPAGDAPAVMGGRAHRHVLSFAHTVGEFGVVLMLGGNRPGVTRTCLGRRLRRGAGDELRRGHATALARSVLFAVLCVTYALQVPRWPAAMSAGPPPNRCSWRISRRHSPAARTIAATVSQPSGALRNGALRPVGVRQDDDPPLPRRTRSALPRPHHLRRRDVEAPRRAGCPAPQRRAPVGYLFQDYALFPHLTVEQNIGYGVNWPPRMYGQLIAEMTERFGLDGLARRRPGELSGGQQQRVALARAMACAAPAAARRAPVGAGRPDERPRRRAAATAPHDEHPGRRRHARPAGGDGAGRPGDRDARRAVRQAGTVEEVFGRPADLTVARIVGVETVVRGKRPASNPALRPWRWGQPGSTCSRSRRRMSPARWTCACAAKTSSPRPPAPADTSGRNKLRAVVTSIVREGPLVRLLFDCRLSHDSGHHPAGEGRVEPHRGRRDHGDRQGDGGASHPAGVRKRESS